MVEYSQIYEKTLFLCYTKFWQVMLVENIETMAKFATSIHKNSNFEDYETFVIDAESEAMELLGSVEYTNLLTNYPNSLTPKQTLLLPLVQKYIVYAAVFAALPDIQNHLTTQGVQQVQQDSGSFYRPSTDKSFALLGETYQTRKYLAADKILEFLEANVTFFEDWRNSPSFTEKNYYFIRNAKEFSAVIHNVNSRQTYLALRAYLDNAEHDIIRKIVGDEMYEDLKAYQYAKLAKEDLSNYPAEYEALFPKIKRICAYHCLNNGLVFLDFVMEGDNLYLASYNNLYKERTTTDQRRVEQVMVKCQEQIKISEKELTEFLQKNYLNYPKYENTVFAADNEKKGHCYQGNGFGPTFSI